jgi:Dioxygenase
MRARQCGEARCSSRKMPCQVPSYRKLTTQVNIDGDEYLHDDFAFATRDGLIPEVRRSADPAEVRVRGLMPRSLRSPSTSSSIVRAPTRQIQ